MEPVILKRVPCYDSDALPGAVEEILVHCGLDNLVTAASRVVLKVNLLMRSAPDEAVTTHPAVVSAVIASLKKRGVSNIVIADGPSGPANLAWLNSIYQHSGMTALVTDGVALNQDLSATVSGRATGSLAEVEILNVMRDADLLINLAKLKTHAMTGMTGAVKNIFGTIPGLKKSQLHFRFGNKMKFCTMLCELCQYISPAISLVDAVTGMEGNGPSGGIPRNFGFVAGACDPFLLDRVLCHAIGMPETLAGTVVASISLGLAPAEHTSIAVAGDTSIVADAITDLVLPVVHGSEEFESVGGVFQPIVRWVMRKTEPSPRIRRKDCIGCAKCAEICPKGIIDIQDQKARIRRTVCIRCFCCHEVCPARAIEIVRTRRLTK